MYNQDVINSIKSVTSADSLVNTRLGLDKIGQYPNETRLTLDKNGKPHLRIGKTRRRLNNEQDKTETATRSDKTQLRLDQIATGEDQTEAGQDKTWHLTRLTMWSP